MKEIIRVEVIPEEVIPAQKIEHREYLCEICGAVFDNEDDAKEHHGNTHAAKEEREIHGYHFIRFDTPEDCQCWCDYIEHYDVVRMHWDGPGWYWQEWHQEPCLRGCCTQYNLTLHPANWLVADLNDKIDSLSTIIAEIRIGLWKEQTS
jgi:hypothetical protein